MSRIVPDKIQDIEKGVEVPDSPNQTLDKSKSKDGSVTAIDPDNGNMTGEEEIDYQMKLNELENENENTTEKKRKVNFNEEANVSWERESIVNDTPERHSNVVVSSFFLLSIPYFFFSST